MRYVVAVVVGLAIGMTVGHHIKKVEHVVVENDERWCFFEEYKTIKEFEGAESPAVSFVTFKNERAQVYKKCEEY